MELVAGIAMGGIDMPMGLGNADGPGGGSDADKSIDSDKSESRYEKSQYEKSRYERSRDDAIDKPRYEKSRYKNQITLNLPSSIMVTWENENDNDDVQQRFGSKITSAWEDDENDNGNADDGDVSPTRERSRGSRMNNDSITIDRGKKDGMASGEKDGKGGSEEKKKRKSVQFLE
jgi:hypothetical protein